MPLFGELDRRSKKSLFLVEAEHVNSEPPNHWTFEFKLPPGHRVQQKQTFGAGQSVGVAPTDLNRPLGVFVVIAQDESKSCTT
jgi:hypothetical protein